MSKGFIETGTNIEFEFFNDLGKKVGETCQGTLKDYVNDDDILVLVTTNMPKTFLTAKTLKVCASFTHPLHGLLKFTGNVVHKERFDTAQGFYGKNIYFTIRIDEDFYEIQKREYYRPVTILKAAYRLVEASKDAINESVDQSLYKPAMTKNISFSGLCVFIEEDTDIVKHDSLDLIVWIDNNARFRALCEVVWVYKVKMGENMTSEIGMTIEKISKEDQKVLKRYITRTTLINTLYWGETPFQK